MTVTSPPLQDLDAERSVLGSMLLEPNVVDLVPGLRPADFVLARHEAIAAAIMSERASTGACDPVAVRARLEREGRLEEAGGFDYLLDLVDSVLSGRHIETHAAIVQERAAQRRVRDVALRMVQRAADGLDAADVATEAELTLREIASTSHREPAWRMRDWSVVATDPPVQWLVEGVEPVGGLLVLGGEPSSGKSAVSQARALAKAHGMSWLGRATRPASTVILAYEGSHGLGVRLRAWRAANPAARRVDDHYLAIVDGGPDLTSPSAHRELVEILDQAARAHGRAPDSLTIDTLNLAMPGIDENDAGALGSVMRTLASVRIKRGVAVELIHHTKKPQQGAPVSGMHALRGSSAIAGAADVVLLASGGKGGRVLRIEKSRDGEVGQPLHYEIIGQDTGITREDGRPEFGPLVVPAEHEKPEADEAAKLASAAMARRGAVVATVERMGGYAPSARSIIERTPGRNRDLANAIKECVAFGDLLPDSKGFRTHSIDGTRFPFLLPPKGGEAAEAGSTAAAGPTREAPGSTGKHGSTRDRRDLE